MHMWLTSTFVLAAAWSTYTDFKNRRISNYVTFGAAALALALRLAFGGPLSLLAGFEGWMLGLALFALPFTLRWMGAGDVKLLAAFGALGGPQFAMQAAVLGCAAGGVMSVFCLLRERRLGYTLRVFGLFVRHPFNTTLAVNRRMPFGPALAAGAVASLALSRALL